MSNNMNGSEKLRLIGEALRRKDFKTVRVLTSNNRARIRELLEKLNAGSSYLAKVGDDGEKLKLIEERAQPLIDELLTYGVDKEVAHRALHLTVDVDQILSELGY